MCINQAYRICLNLFNNSQVLKTKSFTGIFNFLLLPRIDKRISTLLFEGIEQISTRLPFKGPFIMLASWPIITLKENGSFLEFFFYHSYLGNIFFTHKGNVATKF